MIHLRLNGAGMNLRSDITMGQTSDYLDIDPVRNDNLPEPSVLLVDRGQDSDKVRKSTEARKVVQ